MHIGRNIRGYEYHPGTTPLKERGEEKHLGVFITNNLKPLTQVTKAAASANSMVRLLKKTMTCLLNLYKTLVMPRLEYCIQAWAPCTKGDISRLEQV